MNLELRLMPIEDFNMPAGFVDFCCGINVLWYLDKNQRKQLFHSVFTMLRSGGIFAFNLMGILDGWIQSGKQEAYASDAHEIEILCAPWEILFEEEKFFLEPPAGTITPKEWHLYSLLLCKP